MAHEKAIETKPLELVRPSISFESVTFSDGQTLSFEDDEIIVFVGPNNAGKSAALRELQKWIAESEPQKVITNTTLRKSGTSGDLKSYFEKYSQRIGNPADLHYSGIGYNIHHTHLGYFEGASDRHPVAPFFSAHVATETRITASNPAGSIGLHREAPSHPIHLMLIDPALGKTISEYFRNAFGKDQGATQAQIKIEIIDHLLKQLPESYAQSEIESRIDQVFAHVFGERGSRSGNALH